MTIEQADRLELARGEVFKAERYVERLRVSGSFEDMPEARRELEAAKAALEAIEKEVSA